MNRRLSNPWSVHSFVKVELTKDEAKQIEKIMTRQMFGGIRWLWWIGAFPASIGLGILVAIALTWLIPGLPQMAQVALVTTSATIPAIGLAQAMMVSTRAAANELGFSVCLNCGHNLEDLPPDESACPKCRSTVDVSDAGDDPMAE